MRKQRKAKVVPILAGMVLTIGILVFLYPTVSNYLARRQQENIIVGYEETLLQMNDKTIEKEWEMAKGYNENGGNYMSALNIEGNGVMGYIEIPRIDVRLPIYHCANEESLKKGVGHLETTGLPIGGEMNHPVLLGHRGLPNAELFTRLDELKMGDTFYIYVLDQILVYEVNKITVVLPKGVNDIRGQERKDLVTLVTCTPYESIHIDF